MSVRPNKRDRPHVPSSHAAPDLRDPGLARNVAKSPEFVRACALAGVDPTRRQARAFLARRGRWSDARGRAA